MTQISFINTITIDRSYSTSNMYIHVVTTLSTYLRIFDSIINNFLLSRHHINYLCTIACMVVSVSI